MGLRTWLGLKQPKTARARTDAVQQPRKTRPNHVVNVGADAPCLAVLGDFHHFTGSTLAAVLSGHWNMVPAHDHGVAWRNADAFIKWSPWSDYSLPQRLRDLAPRRIINDTHFNCDKANVQAHACRALGYDSRVDPTAHTGPCVMKSRRNAAHDGRVIECPVAAVDAEYAYEVLVDNRHGEDEINDLRLVMILGEIPVAYVKYRPLITRFADANSRVTLTTPDALFSAEELAKCQEFARSIGMQYGEIDILRDNASGRIYIVDANNTPCGPPPQLTAEDRASTLRDQREAIARTFAAHGRADALSPA
jgi:hypothetical protein